jgi:hypothetical protein
MVKFRLMLRLFARDCQLLFGPAVIYLSQALCKNGKMWRPRHSAPLIVCKLERYRLRIAES